MSESVLAERYEDHEKSKVRTETLRDYQYALGVALQAQGFEEGDIALIRQDMMAADENGFEVAAKGYRRFMYEAIDYRLAEAGCSIGEARDAFHDALKADPQAVLDAAAAYVSPQQADQLSAPQSN